MDVPVESHAGREATPRPVGIRLPRPCAAGRAAAWVAPVIVGRRKVAVAVVDAVLKAEC